MPNYYSSTDYKRSKQSKFTKPFVDSAGYWYDAWKVVFGFMLVFAFFFGIGKGVTILERNACANNAHAMDREWHKAWNSDCMLKGDDGKFYPANSIREPDHR